MDNLWGFKRGAVPISTPKEIVDEQAYMLSKMTSDMVTAKVVELKKNPLVEKNSFQKSFSFEYNFIIEAKYLPNYKLILFNVGFNIPVYPAYIRVNADLKKELEEKYEKPYYSDGYQVESEDEFLYLLKLVLSSDYVSNVVNTLIKMSEDQLPF